MELRMYGLVPYNISPIQKAIQFGHAVVEYGIENFNTDEYQDWARNWKTFIILDGGTSNHTINRYSLSDEYLGSMEQNMKILLDNNIKISTFYEPDLNDMLSSIVFIVDERVFNLTVYPNYNSEVESYEDWVQKFGNNKLENDKIIFLRSFLNNLKLA